MVTARTNAIDASAGTPPRQPVGRCGDPERDERVDMPAVRDFQHHQRIPRIRERQPFRALSDHQPAPQNGDGEEVARDQRQLHRAGGVVQADDEAEEQLRARVDTACVHGGSASAAFRSYASLTSRGPRERPDTGCIRASGRARPRRSAPCRCPPLPAESQAAPETPRRSANAAASSPRGARSSRQTRARMSPYAPAITAKQARKTGEPSGVFVMTIASDRSKEGGTREREQ